MGIWTDAERAAWRGLDTVTTEPRRTLAEKRRPFTPKRGTPATVEVGQFGNNHVMLETRNGELWVKHPDCPGERLALAFIDKRGDLRDITWIQHGEHGRRGWEPHHPRDIEAVRAAIAELIKHKRLKA